MIFQPHDLVGTTIGSDLRVLQHRASGGIGHVYTVKRHRSQEEPFALKLLRPELGRRPAMVKRFEREAIAASHIRHPNVLFVHGPAVSEGELTYFTMELLEGLDLADTLAHWAQLTAVRAVRIARGIALGLEASHAAGIVHRDLKPENVFLVHSSDGRELVKLLDFGASAMGGDVALGQEAGGTPEYAAPEARSKLVVEASADVYALGVVLHEMLTGDATIPRDRIRPIPPVPPSQPSSASTGKPASARRAYLLPDVSEELDNLTREMLATDPRARPEAGEVAKRLAETLEGR